MICGAEDADVGTEIRRHRSSASYPTTIAGSQVERFRSQIGENVVAYAGQQQSGRSDQPGEQTVRPAGCSTLDSSGRPGGSNAAKCFMAV